MRDKNGVAIPEIGGAVDWDDYQKWLYTQPIDDQEIGTINIKEWEKILDIER